MALSALLGTLLPADPLMAAEAGIDQARSETARGYIAGVFGFSVAPRGVTPPRGRFAAVPSPCRVQRAPGAP
jgi:hypothetical protein